MDSERLDHSVDIADVSRFFMLNRYDVCTELLQKLKTRKIEFVARLVSELLVAMGYARSPGDVLDCLKDEGKYRRLGVIQTDVLGLNRLLVLIEHTSEPIPVDAVRKAVKAVQGNGSEQVLVITTGTFYEDAQEYASSLTGVRLALLDGGQLSSQLVEYRLAVEIVSTYELLRVG